MVGLLGLAEIDASAGGSLRGSGFGSVFNSSRTGMGGGGGGMDTADITDGALFALEDAIGRPSSSSLKLASSKNSTSLKKTNCLKKHPHWPRLNFNRK